jgi:hypothetical protein
MSAAAHGGFFRSLCQLQPQAYAAGPNVRIESLNKEKVGPSRNAKTLSYRFGLIHDFRGAWASVPLTLCPCYTNSLPICRSEAALSQSLSGGGRCRLFGLSGDIAVLKWSSIRRLRSRPFLCSIYLSPSYFTSYPHFTSFFCISISPC